MEFSEKLKLMRKEAGLTQEELAGRLHITRQAVSNYEQGRGYPSIDILVSVAELFKVTLDELLSANGVRRQTRLILALLAEACACIFVAMLAVYFRVQRGGLLLPFLAEIAFAFFFPVLAALIGAFMQVSPPKRNKFFGYRTKRSMKSDTAWAFAQAATAELFCKTALAMFGVVAVYAVAAIFLRSIADMVASVCLSALFIAALIAVVCVVEHKLKKLFG